jgi:hypothetical protein
VTRHRNRAWTDWNTHDPGITLLEALAYSVSDLAFDVRHRLVAGKCGWRCALAIAAGTAGAIMLIRYAKIRRDDRFY